MSRILHLISTGIRGGQESLLSSYINRSKHENVYCCLYIKGPLLDELRESGFEVKDLSGCSILAKRREISKMIRSGEYDVLFNHSYIGKTVFILNSLNFGNAKLIQYMHSAFEPELLPFYKRTPLHYLTTKKIYRKATVCIAISEYVKRVHVRSFGDIQNCKVVYNGVDTRRYKTSSDLNRPISRKVQLLYLGRVTRIKGVHKILEMCSNLDSFNVEYSLDIVGRILDEDYGEELSQCAKSLKGDVAFYGETATPEKFYSKADIFIHNALCAEGFGLALVEAMSSGCICIASNRGAIPEVLEDAGTGFLVDPCDTDKIAETVRRVIKMPDDEILSFRQRASRCADRYSLDGYVSSVDMLVDEIAK